MPLKHPLALWIAAVLLVMWGADAMGCNYLVHVVEPAVTDHMILKDGLLPPICKEWTQIRMRACRGEYEPASFVVTAAKPLADVRIEIDQVTGPGRKWPADAIDVCVVKDYYRGTLAGGAAAMPMLTPHPPGHLETTARNQISCQLEMVRLYFRS